MVFTGLPSEKMIMVGTDDIPYRSAVSGVVVDADLGHGNLAGELVREVCEHRRHHLARPAPGSPEINEHRDARIQHVRGKRSVSDTLYVHGYLRFEVTVGPRQADGQTGASPLGAVSLPPWIWAR